MANTISAIIRTLNTITVSGEDNLDKLLACIRALKQIGEQIGKEEQHGENDGEL